MSAILQLLSIDLQFLSTCLLFLLQMYKYVITSFCFLPKLINLFLFKECHFSPIYNMCLLSDWTSLFLFPIGFLSYLLKMQENASQ